MPVARAPGSVLYVHPRHLHLGRDSQVPMGAITLANAVGAGVHGLFAYELSGAALRQAAILMMDVHWFFAIESAIRIASLARRVNPSIRIIAGGYSATIFGRDLLARSEIDFVVRGDAERPLPALVRALLDGGDPSSVPNVSGREFSSPLSYSLTRQDYDAGDNLTIAWFPTLERTARRTHSIPYPTWIYPFIPVFKGCAYPCDYCLGSPVAQRLLCNRGIVSRSPDRVVEDLRRVERSPFLRRAYVIADFLTILGPGYADPILADRYGLDLYYEFYRMPTPAEVRRLASSFRKLFLGCFFTRNHGATPEVEEQLARLREVPGACREVGADLALNLHMEALRDSPAACRRLLDLYRANPWIRLIDSSLWDIPMPSAQNVGRPEPGAFERFRALSGRRPLGWRVREAIASACFRGRRRWSALFRANTWRVALGLFVSGGTLPGARR